MPDWKKFCWAKSTIDSSCNDGALVSSLSFLEMQGIDDLERASQEEINTAFIKSISNQATWKGGLQFLFTHKQYIVSSGKVQYMRSFMDFGSPFEYEDKNFIDITDRYPEQREIITTF